MSTEQTQWTELATTSDGDLILENDEGEIFLVVPIKRFHPADGWAAKTN